MFLGMVKEEEKYTLIKSHKVLVLSSLKEYTPSILLEAQVLGVPVIATDVIEYRLWYSRGLYTFSSYDDLEKIIKYILDNVNQIKNDLINYATFLYIHSAGIT